MINSTQLRDKFLDFFKKRNHAIIPSAPLVPENDPTVLFITAGMHPLVPYLLGQPHPAGKRLTNVQKCLRTDDIDEVGDATHNTFFEMLGNWSLGDYWKKEALSWSYEFLTSKQWLGLDPERLFVTVFKGDKDAPKDTESIEIWQALGISKERITEYGKDKNWWGPAGETGPCGPDSEMFFDTGKPHDVKFGAECHPNCNCGRFVEIWNDVFMQYNKKPDGTFEELKQRNVDTGMGLERMTMILEGKESIYETELFSGAIEAIKDLTSQEKYDERSIRIVADHLRAAAFLVLDGVAPSNKERGYILRRLIRRSVVKLSQLGAVIPMDVSLIIRRQFQVYSGRYGVEEFKPTGENSSDKASEIINAEIDRFAGSLDRGLKEVKKIEKIDGKTAFDLYQTYGFPLELTEELFSQKGQRIDKEEFKKEFEKHQALSRVGAEAKFKGGLADQGEQTTKLHTATHLLQAALREVLGPHVYQKGSNITPERLRFDFSSPEKVTEEQLKKVEDLVNQKIKEDLPVVREEMSVEEAKRIEAIGLFTEKYGEKVSVYTVGQPSDVFSREICGGPHVTHTGVLGRFKIVKEEAVSAGVRRIKAILE